MFVGSFPSVSASVTSSIRSAEHQLSAAASSAARGDMDGFVDAALEMSSARMTMGVASLLSRTQDQMVQGMLDMLV